MYRLLQKYFFLVIFISLSLCGKAQEQDSIIQRMEQIGQMEEDSAMLRSYLSFADSIIDAEPQLALEVALKSLEISNNITHNKGHADALFLLGRIYYSQGNYAQALDQLKQSLALTDTINNRLRVAEILNQLGNNYLQQGEYALSLEYYLKGLKIRENINDSLGIASSYNNIGNVFYKQYDLEQALEYYHKSVEIDIANKNEEGFASTYINIGVIQMDMGNYNEALEFYNKSLETNLALNNKKNVASCYNNIAAVYDEQGDFEKAIEYYNKSLTINEEIGSKQGIAATYYSIGLFYTYYGKYAKSVESLDKSLKIGQEIGSARIVEQAAMAISESYFYLHDYKKAYQYRVLYEQYKQRVNNEENVKRITQLEMQYQFDKKQKEIEFQQQQREIEHEAELNRQKLVTAFFIVGFILMIMLAWVIFRSYKVKKRDNQLLAQQKEEILQKNTLLESQKSEILHQRDEIRKQNQEIKDSIHYARRIQNAILPPDEFIHEVLSDYFILNKPRDIVSGDFYWLTEADNKIIVVAADCTGHGVPGAFMSMLGVSFLNDIVNKSKVTQANEILNLLRQYVIQSLHQTGKKDEAKDGMDISLTVIDKESKKIQYAGAYNPVYVIRDSEIHVLKADRMPIGIYVIEDQEFTLKEMALEENDTIYMFSDGYVDQFGGPNNRKFKAKPFKELLLSINHLPMNEQKIHLDKTLIEWQGNNDQVDDILVIGVKI